MPRITKQNSLKDGKRKTTTVAFRLPEEIIDYLDDITDGIYIRDRTHALRLILEKSYRTWLITKDNYNYPIDYTKSIFDKLFESEEKTIDYWRWNSKRKDIMKRKKIIIN